MSPEVSSAAAAVLQDAVNTQQQKTAEFMSQLASAYLQTKLQVLQEKVALLQNVDVLFDQERCRLDVEKKDVQIQKAQLALFQQQVYPEVSNVTNIM